MYALVDCNNFYCSCERVFNPKLNGRPVIVLSNNDGCAIARSEEAKACGIDMGMPTFMIEELIKKNNVAVFSSNYTLYGDMSDRVMKILAGFTPTLELYSIDEAFLDLSGFAHKDLLQMGIDLRKTVAKYTGIPITVGIARTKTLAKMANRYAKKKKQAIGVHYLADQVLIDEVLNGTEVGDIWGVGKQYQKFLLGHGIKTAAQLAKAGDEWVKKSMTVVGQRMINELRGIACIKWEEEPSAKKAICNARSFGHLVTNKEHVKEAVSSYASNVALKLRNQKSCARVIHVFIQTNAFRSEDKQYFRSVNMQLPVATNATNEIILYALKALDIIYSPGYRFLKAGVIVMDIVPEDQIQHGIFDTVDRARDNKLMTAMDKINRALGKDLVRFAVQGYDKKWKLRAAHLSDRYTTNINELLTIKI